MTPLTTLLQIIGTIPLTFPLIRNNGVAQMRSREFWLYRAFFFVFTSVYLGMAAVSAHCRVSFVTCLLSLHVAANKLKAFWKNLKCMATGETQETIPAAVPFLQESRILICKTKTIAFRARTTVAPHDWGDK